MTDWAKTRKGKALTMSRANQVLGQSSLRQVPLHRLSVRKPFEVSSVTPEKVEHDVEQKDVLRVGILVAVERVFSIEYSCNFWLHHRVGDHAVDHRAQEKQLVHFVPVSGLVYEEPFSLRRIFSNQNAEFAAPEYHFSSFWPV